MDSNWWDGKDMAGVLVPGANRRSLEHGNCFRATIAPSFVYDDCPVGRITLPFLNNNFFFPLGRLTLASVNDKFVFWERLPLPF